VGEGTVDFAVVDGQVADVQQLGNYPNPFTNSTTFVFEHNHPEEQLTVSIEIYNMSGALVKNIKEDITPGDSRTSEITWDGTGNSGDRLPSGVYVYRLNLATEKGFKTSAYQKLVIVR
jgi:flagellar hook assembly protein FlgD